MAQSMSEVARASAASASSTAAIRVASDLLALTKPRVTLLVVWTALTAALVAPGPHVAGRIVATTAGTTLMVGAANALNMCIERDVDARMSRTRRRPLPAGRLALPLAFAFALLLAVVATTTLLLGASLVATGLGLAALAIYVAVYTPLKRRTPSAVWIGGVAGAVPPLIGWTATSGGFGAGGWMLFALLFFWQVTHFGAIAIVRRGEYAGAGLAVISVECGSRAAVRAVQACAVLWVAISLCYPLISAGHLYAFTAASAGAITLSLLLRSPSPGGETRWAWRAFHASNAHLAVLLVALLVDRAIRG